MRTLPRSITVQIDTREKKPYSFPDVLRCPSFRTGELTPITVKKERVKLIAGDYALKGWKKVCLIERKLGLSELEKNLFGDDWPRFQKCVEKLRQSTLHPYLFVEGTVRSLHSPGPGIRRDPDAILGALFNTCALHNVTILWAGSAGSTATRKLVGTMLLRTMLSHVIEHRSKSR